MKWHARLQRLLFLAFTHLHKGELMTFNDKFKFLMDITNTNNTTLAGAVGIDNSAVSLYRSGKRKCPRNKEVLRRMSDYFALQLNSAIKERLWLLRLIIADSIIPDLCLNIQICFTSGWQMSFLRPIHG